MANPSPAAIALIREQVTDWTDDDASIAAMLNAPSIANPTERPTIAKPLEVRDFMDALDVSAKAKLFANPNLTRILEDIAGGTTETLENWVSAMVDAAVATPAQATALLTIIRATEPDPAWPEQISWAESVIGRLVDTLDIAEARPGDAQ